MSTLRVTNIEDLAGNPVFSLSGGNMTVAGNLTVQGTTTSIETTNLQVEDKNIILGLTTPVADDEAADGGGITLKGTTDKTITWVDGTDAWTSSERFSIPLGAEGTPSLTFTGDPNTGIYSPGADQVAISTNGTGRLFVDASGNVGVGVNAPTSVSGNKVLEIEGTSGTEVIIGSTATSVTVGDFFGGLAFKSLDANGTPPHYSGIQARAADTFGGATLNFYVGRDNYENNDPRVVIEGPQSVAGEALRIDSSGKLLVGTFSSRSVAGAERRVQIEGIDASSVGLSLVRNSAAGGVGPAVTLVRTRGTAVGASTAVANGDILGYFQFAGANGTDLSNVAAWIAGEVDGDPFTSGDTTDLPGRLVFSTTADGASIPTERMRISSTGKISFGGGSSDTVNLINNLPITGGTSSYGIYNNNEIRSDVTSNVQVFVTYPRTQAASFTLTNLTHYAASQNTFGSGSSVTNQYGFSVASNLTGATNNYGFYSNISTGSGRWNFYAVGSAANYFAGNVGIGTADPSVKLDVRTTKSSTALYAEGRAEFRSNPNWNYSGLRLIRESTNTSQAKLISFMLGGDDDADTNLYNYPNIVLRTTSTPISTSTSVGLSAKLEITAPTGVDLGVGTKPILKTTSAGVDVNGSITESTDGGTTYHNVVTAQDIGTDPNQVPLNQFLGQLAFMDEVGDVPAASSAPQENRSINFEYVSDTSIKIRMRGDDGVVRSFTITPS